MNRGMEWVAIAEESVAYLFVFLSVVQILLCYSRHDNSQKAVPLLGLTFNLA